MHFDLVEFVKAVGTLGVFAIVFAESGLLIGFFLPGDSLIFTAGFLASQGFLYFPLLVVGVFLSATAGDSVGYAFGKKVGPAIFKKSDSLLFSQDYLKKAEIFYEKHGKITIVLARFIPVVRTFAPILAGVGRMSYKTFFAYNVIGALVWGVGITSLGYYLGNAIPNIDRYLLPIIAVIIFSSFLPGIVHLIRDKSLRAKVWAFIRRKN